MAKKKASKTHPQETKGRICGEEHEGVVRTNSYVRERGLQLTSSFILRGKAEPGEDLEEGMLHTNRGGRSWPESKDMPRGGHRISTNTLTGHLDFDRIPTGKGV